jgi:hypothetical protein
MRPVKKEIYIDKIELRSKIHKLADLIRDGEEDLLEEYNEKVEQYAAITMHQGPASETDPIAWDLFCELAGGDPGKIVYAGGRRGLNYEEMLRFNRGYWR